MEKRIEIVDVRRRALLKSGLAASAAMTIGLPVSAEEKAAATASEDGIAWHKGVCRFCGTGPDFRQKSHFRCLKGAEVQDFRAFLL